MSDEVVATSYTRGRDIPRGIHTKDLHLLEERVKTPVLSLTKLLKLDEQERVVKDDDPLSMDDTWESIDVY